MKPKPMTVAAVQPDIPLEWRESRLRIAIVDHTAALGGGEIALLNFVSRLDREKYDPLVILFSDGPLRHKLAEAGVRIAMFPLNPRVNNVRKDTLKGKSLLRIPRILAAICFSFRLSRFLLQEKFDLVHTNSLKSDVLGGLAARLAGIPVIWHIRDRIDLDYLPKTAVRIFRCLARFVPRQVVANSAATLDTIQLPKHRLRTTIYSGISIASSAGLSMTERPRTTARTPNTSHRPKHP